MQKSHATVPLSTKQAEQSPEDVPLYLIKKKLEVVDEEKVGGEEGKLVEVIQRRDCNFPSEIWESLSLKLHLIKWRNEYFTYGFNRHFSEENVRVCKNPLTIYVIGKLLFNKKTQNGVVVL